MSIDLSSERNLRELHLTTEDLTIHREAWMDDAACKGRTRLFFGVAGERPERRVRREADARTVCASCPVLQTCRTMARDGRENGFWGGESDEERAAAGYPPRSISRRAVQQASLEAAAS